MLKSKMVFYFCCLILIGLVFGPADVAAQTVAYRQTQPRVER